MRFDRRPRYEFRWSELKAKAVLRKQQREREALPLFAAEIAADQPTVAEVEAKRRQAFIESEQEWRDRDARDWRRARAELRALSDPLRGAVLRYWNHDRWLPGKATYLSSLILRVQRGEYVLKDGKLESYEDPGLQARIRERMLEFELMRYG